MLTMRKEQMQTFEKAALGPFEDEMVRHSEAFAPQFSGKLHEDQLRVALRGAMEKAGDCGFTHRGPMRLVIEMMFLFGSEFDSDPQFPWAAQILSGSEDQMQRAELLCQKILDYQKVVSGHDAANTRNAMVKLLETCSQPTPFSAVAAGEFAPGMLGELHRIFPQKAAYAGDEALIALIQKGSAVARAHRLPPGRGGAMLVAWMFAFGHGCADDPLYPWIERTLADESIAEGEGRARALEKKAATWLEHLLATPPDDTPT